MRAVLCCGPAAWSPAPWTRSDAVLQEPPDVGLHKQAHSVLDSKMIMRELRLAQVRGGSCAPEPVRSWLRGWAGMWERQPGTARRLQQ